MTLREAREIHGMSRKQLSLDAKVGLAVIRDIENGTKKYKTKWATAIRLADSLAVRVLEVFDRNELSHLGRTPGTGRKLEIVATVTFRLEVTGACPDCFLAYTPTGACYCQD